MEHVNQQQHEAPDENRNPSLRRLRRLGEQLLAPEPTATKSGVYERGQVRIHYEEAGSGFPLLVIPGGGLNSTVAGLSNTPNGHPFNPLEEFKDRYRVIAADLRNANGGGSSGPVEVDRPWDSYTEDHIGLMDHLGIDKFMVMGFCIGGPFIWNLLRLHGSRVVAAVLVQPSGYNPEHPGFFVKMNSKGWGPPLSQKRPEIKEDTWKAFLENMYTKREDFVFTVTRDFVKSCQTSILILPDNIPPHPYAVAMETSRLAPNARVSVFPWKDSQGEEGKQNLPQALRHVGDFLRQNEPAATVTKEGAIKAMKKFMGLLAKDVPAAMALCTEDFAWENFLPSNVPFGGRYEGAAGVQKYLAKMNETWVIGKLEFQDFMWDPDTLKLAAPGVEKNGKAIATGRSCDMPFVWEFRFARDGKLQYLREYNDGATIGGTFAAA